MSAPDGLHAAFFRTAGTLGKLYKRSHAFLPQRVRGQFALLLNEIKPFMLPPVPLCTADLHRGRPEVSVIADALVRLACKGDFVLEVPALQPPRVLHLAEVLPAPSTPPTRAGAPTSSTPPRPLRAEAPCFVPASLTDGLDRSVKDSQPAPGESTAGHAAGIGTASPLDRRLPPVAPPLRGPCRWTSPSRARRRLPGRSSWTTWLHALLNSWEFLAQITWLSSCTQLGERSITQPRKVRRLAALRAGAHVSARACFSGHLGQRHQESAFP
mmetsp:Transcript_32526/g.96812  ORF Transcript_32526/g.96812 Transcript_32526/m.96812 type:complete len:270 (+) Transcript_32526:49-858(+)